VLFTSVSERIVGIFGNVSERLLSLDVGVIAVKNGFNSFRLFFPSALEDALHVEPTSFGLH